MLELKFIGADGWDRPVYRDGSGKLWKDVNLGRGEPSLYSSVNNTFEGEPNMPIKGEYTIISEESRPAKRVSTYERTKAAVYATGNKWAIENFHATHD